MTDKQEKLAKKYIPSHYLTLLHSDVLVGENRIPGVTSVTSLDLHDIARSSCTYGVKNFFIVTPLSDQQKIVKILLNFWQEGDGVQYNKNRHEAIKSLQLLASIESDIGDTIAVSQRIKEGNKERIQIFQGDVIAMHQKGSSSTFTVRKIGANSISVERIYPFHATFIDSVKVVRKGDVRRAKLYYIRDRVGKAARIKEKIVKRKPKVVTKSS